jgi:CBS domain-containing protein
MLEADRRTDSHVTPEEKTDAAHDARSESVRNLGLREFVCVAPTTTIREAAARMESAETDGIFVCDEGRVVGVVTHRNLLAHVADGKLNLDGEVGECMSVDVLIVSSAATLGEVVRLMNEGGQTHVAVTESIEDDRFVGAITDLDIITYLAESYPKETINLPPVAAQIMDTREGG